MSTITVGNNTGGFSQFPSVTVDRVVVSTNGDSAYYAPSGLTDSQWYAMTGKIMNVTIPFGTQAIANSLLATLSATPFKPYQAECAELNPAAEIGDWVTIGGITSVIAKRVYYLDTMGTSDISADTENEVTDKYPYISDANTNVERTLEQFRSQLSVQSNKIGLVVEQVQGTDVIKSASIITAINDNSTVQISADKVGISGLVEFADLDGSRGVTVIDGSVIETDTIALNDIKCRGDAIEIKDSQGNSVGSLGYETGMSGSGVTQGMAIKYDGTHYVICTSAGVRLQSGSNSIWVTDSGTSIGQAVFG